MASVIAFVLIFSTLSRNVHCHVSSLTSLLFSFFAGRSKVTNRRPRWEQYFLLYPFFISFIKKFLKGSPLQHSFRLSNRRKSTLDVYFKIHFVVVNFFFFQPLSKIRQGLETKRDMTVRTFDYLFRTMQRGKGTPKNPPTVSAQFQVCSCAWSILPVEVWVGTWQIEALNIN